jgi:hypothetical protein
MRLPILLVAGLAATAVADRKQEVWPNVVTRSWLEEFGQRKWPLARIVASTRGLIVIEHLVDTGADNDAGVRTAKRFCGMDLEKALPALQARVLDSLKHADTIACSNRPGPPACSFKSTFEWTVTTILRFHRAADGTLTLEAVLFVDGGAITRNEKAMRRQDTFVETKLAALANTPC